MERWEIVATHAEMVEAGRVEEARQYAQEHGLKFGRQWLNDQMHQRQWSPEREVVSGRGRVDYERLVAFLAEWRTGLEVRDEMRFSESSLWMALHRLKSEGMTVEKRLVKGGYAQYRVAARGAAREAAPASHAGAKPKYARDLEMVAAYMQLRRTKREVVQFVGAQHDSVFWYLTLKLRDAGYQVKDAPGAGRAKLYWVERSEG